MSAFFCRNIVVLTENCNRQLQLHLQMQMQEILKFASICQNARLQNPGWVADVDSSKYVVLNLYHVASLFCII